MLVKGNLSPKFNSYGNMLPSYLLYIFEFQLVFFAFSLLCFSRGINFAGKIYRQIVLHDGTNDHIIPRGTEFHKMHFPVI